MLKQEHVKLFMNVWFGFVLLLFAVSIFAFEMNPITDIAGTDNGVFAYIGEGMRHGLMPYRDMFDHKGPLLYIINWAGMSMGIGYAGVWIIDILMYLLSFGFALFTFSRILGRKNTLLAAVPIIWIFIHLFCCGNMTESYATYVTLVAWSLFVRDINDDKLGLFTCFVQGVAVGAILLLRPNMIGFAIPVIVYCFGDLIQNKGIKQFFIRCASGVVGIMIVVLPICAWMMMLGILDDCWDCYIKFNLLYLAKNKYTVTPEILLPSIVTIVNIWLIKISEGKKRRLLQINLIYLLSAFGIVLMKLTYEHYYLPILPAMMVPLVCIYDGNRGRIIGFLRVLILPLAAIFIIYWPVTLIINVRKLVTSVIKLQMPVIERRISPKEETYRQLRDLIGEDETVCTMGCPSIYYKIKRRCNSKYFYTFITCWDGEKIPPICDNLKAGVDDYVLLYKDKRPADAVMECISQYYMEYATVGDYTVMKFKGAATTPQERSGENPTISL